MGSGMDTSRQHRQGAEDRPRVAPDDAAVPVPAPGSGGEDGFVALFRDQYLWVLRTVVLIVGDQEVARDLTQEAFARGFVRWRRVATLEAPGGWIRRVAIRLAVREAERTRRRPELERRALAGSRSPAAASAAARL